MKCHICGQKIKPGTDKEYIPVTGIRERAVHPGCKENAKQNQRNKVIS